MRKVVVAAAVLLVGLVPACGEGGDVAAGGPPAATEQTLRDAVARLRGQDRIGVTISYSFDLGEADDWMAGCRPATGDQAYSMTIDQVDEVVAVASEGSEVAIVDRDVVYLAASVVPGEPPTPWVRADEWLSGLPLLGYDSMLLSMLWWSGDPAAEEDGTATVLDRVGFLDGLDDAIRMEPAGSTMRDGEALAGLRITLDPVAWFGGAGVDLDDLAGGGYPVDTTGYAEDDLPFLVAWFDGEGRLRHLESHEDGAPGAGAEDVPAMAASVNLVFDVDEPPPVRVPTEGEVTPLGSLPAQPFVDAQREQAACLMGQAGLDGTAPVPDALLECLDEAGDVGTLTVEEHVGAVGQGGLGLGGFGLGGECLGAASSGAAGGLPSGWQRCQEALLDQLQRAPGEAPVPGGELDPPSEDPSDLFEGLPPEVRDACAGMDDLLDAGDLPG